MSLLTLAFVCQPDFGNETVTGGHSMCRYPRADQTNVIVEPIPFCKLPHLIDDAAEKFFQRKCEPRKPAPPVTTETGSEFLAIEELF